MATFNPSDVLATVAGYGQLTVQQIRYWAKISSLEPDTQMPLAGA
mgnify:FL=1